MAERGRWYRNRGKCPRSVAKKDAKVYVRLRGGHEPKEPWTVLGYGGKPLINWTRTPDDQYDPESAAAFEIEAWSPAN